MMPARASVRRVRACPVTRASRRQCRQTVVPGRRSCGQLLSAGDDMSEARERDQPAATAVARRRTTVPQGTSTANGRNHWKPADGARRPPNAKPPTRRTAAHNLALTACRCRGFVVPSVHTATTRPQDACCRPRVTAGTSACRAPVRAPVWQAALRRALCTGAAQLGEGKSLYRNRLRQGMRAALQTGVCSTPSHSWRRSCASFV